MEEEIVIRLIDFIETASPKLWAIMLRQVWVTVILNLLGGALCAIGSIALVKLAIWSLKKADGDEYSLYNILTIASWIGAILSLGIGIAILFSAIGQALNPEYHAITNMFRLIR